MTGLRLGLAVVLALGFAILGAAAGERPADPAASPDFLLDLDTGGHRGTVNALAFTPDGQMLLSASDDKTIRVWDWRSGRPIRTLRGYVGAGNDGKVFALAVSPDGATVAAAGYFGAGVGADPPYGDVRLFDLSTGRIKAVLPGNALPVSALAFAPDGGRLAAAGQDGFVYLWRKDDRAPLGWTEDTRLDAESTGIEAVAFADGGSRIVATTADYGIRLWDAATGEDIALPAEAEPLRVVAVAALAVSPDGGRFATGSADGRVQVWDAGDGRMLASTRLDFAIGTLDFSADRLWIACGYACGARGRLFTWSIDDAPPAPSATRIEGVGTASAISPDGATLVSAGGGAHALSVVAAASGQVLATLQGEGGAVTAVGIDAAGGAIAWGGADPCPGRTLCPDVPGGFEHRLALPTSDRFFQPPEIEDDAAPYRRAMHEAGPWRLAAGKGGPDGLDGAVLEIVHDGKPGQRIVNDAGNGAVHASFTLIDRGLRLITGGADGTLLEYHTATARQAGEFLGGHTGMVLAIAAAEPAGLLVTGGADQTIRLWNLKTRELIVSMLFAGKDWVVWMPQGYYYASDDGDKLIGWHVNQGRGKEARFVRAEQLRRFLWSPEMVRRAIVLRSASAAVKEMRPGVDGELQKLLQRKPPEFEVRLAADQSGVRDGFVAVEIDASPETGVDPSAFAILANSRNVGGAAMRAAPGGGPTIVEIPVEEGENTIRITGTDDFGYLTERSVIALGKKKTARKAGKLYLVAVGVDDYPLLGDGCGGRSCDLRYPVDDAAEIARVIAERTAPLFSGVEALVLVNRDALEKTPERARAVEALMAGRGIQEPEADTVRDGLADFLEKPGPDDTTIVFIAGHGVNVDEDYYFIPTDGRRQDGDKWRRSSLVRWSDIQEPLEDAAGMRLMLLDTCHAANAFNPRLEKDAADARIVVFSATAANNTALEMSELGHGVFTYSLLSGLKGAARTSQDGVTLLGLADYVSREVVELTAARQKPYYYASGVENMLLAIP